MREPLRDPNAPVTGVSTQGGAIPWDPNSKVNANTVIGLNTAGNVLNMGLDAWKTGLNYKLMSGMLDLQGQQMTKYYDLQGRLVDLNTTMISSQEKIQFKAMDTTKAIAEIQKDRDVAVAQSKAVAAVKIAKVNALNAQFYGQANQLPSIGA